MSTPYLSELRVFSFNFAPKGWAICNGQLLPINQNQALFSLLGTTYGGNGQTFFALPNLQGRVPVHFGNGFTLGQAGGETTHTLTQSELPTHTHLVGATSDAGTATVPSATTTLGSIAGQAYKPLSGATPVTLNPSSVTSTGGNTPHPNQQPYLVLNICIALQGIFPSQN